MPRFTQLEIDALTRAINEIQAGDSVEFFLGYSAEEDDTMTREERKDFNAAKRLSAALESASLKLVRPRRSRKA